MTPLCFKQELFIFIQSPHEIKTFPFSVFLFPRYEFGYFRYLTGYLSHPCHPLKRIHILVLEMFFFGWIDRHPLSIQPGGSLLRLRNIGEKFSLHFSFFCMFRSTWIIMAFHFFYSVHVHFRRSNIRNGEATIEDSTWRWVSYCSKERGQSNVETINSVHPHCHRRRNDP
jgi:hypothetical protein